jgi:hypothetical protein
MAERIDKLAAAFWGWIADRFYGLWKRCCARAWNAEHRLRIRWAMRNDPESPF